MHARNLDQVIGLLAQRLRHGPAAIRRDMQNHYPQAKILHLSHDLGQVLVGARDERIADRAVLGQGYQVPPELGLYPLSPARPDVDEPQLDSRHVGQGVVFRGASAIGHRLVPVAA
jgi:hypothetical protein